jgi:imidazoleglycerol-phosphate dehydratase
MSEPQTKLDPASDLPDIPPERRNGSLVILEGGEVDRTIRPSRFRLAESTPEGERSSEESEFLKALEDYKQATGKLLPSWADVLEVLRTLGYRKIPEPIVPPAMPTRSRTATIHRETGETRIDLTIALDGMGRAEVATGIGFFDHMLTLLAKHSLIDLEVKAVGDLQVDAHHTVEDVGICFGKALAQALGDKAGIRRYGSATLPMDEALVTAAVDLSGRPFCVWQAEVPLEMLGTFNAPLAEEFWRAVSASGAFNLHVVGHHGRNTHHLVEAIFKATARALRQAIETDPRMAGVPSTKGVL